MNRGMQVVEQDALDFAARRLCRLALERQKSRFPSALIGVHLRLKFSWERLKYCGEKVD
jgi:hypothetical protein